MILRLETHTILQESQSNFMNFDENFLKKLNDYNIGFNFI